MPMPSLALAIHPKCLVTLTATVLFARMACWSHIPADTFTRPWLCLPRPPQHSRHTQDRRGRHFTCIIM
jgi:hypothetical protein